MLGNKVREFRKSRHLTLAELAANLGISESYLSQLESEKVDPSLSLVRKLASEFHVPIAAFFDMEYEKPIVTRLGDRVVTTLNNESVILSKLSPAGDNVLLNICEFVLQPDAEMMHTSTKYHTCLFVMEGSLSITFGETQANLSEGDSIFLPSKNCARLTNDSSIVCKGLLSTKEENGGTA